MTGFFVSIFSSNTTIAAAALALASTQALAIDCTLSTTTGNITWANGTYTPVDAGQGTEQWLCVHGVIYRPYRAPAATTVPAPHHAAPATNHNRPAQYNSPYYRNHSNQIPYQHQTDKEQADYQFNAVDRNL